jgi:hypothetical protein
MPKANARVAGHTLRAEGAPFDEAGAGPMYHYEGKVGRAKCSCGALSEMLPTNAARRRWHADHKAAVVAGGVA